MNIAASIPLRDASRPATLLALAAVYILWGGTYLAIRVALGGYPPFLLGAVRMAIAGTLMFIVLRWQGHKAPTGKQWRALAVLSVWMVLLSNGLLNLGETQVHSGLAAITVASVPLFAGIFSALRGRRLSKMEWLGLLIGFSGVVWLNATSELSSSPVGFASLLAASISWAWGSIWGRDQDIPGPFMSAAAQMLVGSMWLLIISLVSGERLSALPSLEATGAMLYLVVAGSIVGFTAYMWLLHHVRPALATSYAYVNPPIAVFLGAVLNDERFGLKELAAMMVVVGGVALITLAKPREVVHSAKASMPD